MSYVNFAGLLLQKKKTKRNRTSRIWIRLYLPSATLFCCCALLEAEVIVTSAVFGNALTPIRSVSKNGIITSWWSSINRFFPFSNHGSVALWNYNNKNVSDLRKIFTLTHLLEIMWFKIKSYNYFYFAFLNQHISLCLFNTLIYHKIHKWNRKLSHLRISRDLVPPYLEFFFFHLRETLGLKIKIRIWRWN